MNSAPTRTPAGSKRWPNTPYPLPSCMLLCHTTTKLPRASIDNDGQDWLLAATVLTTSSPAAGVCAAAGNETARGIARTARADRFMAVLLQGLFTHSP